MVTIAPPLAAEEPHRSHITLAGGYEDYVRDNFENDGLEGATLGHLGFRYSLRSGFDICFEFRGTWASEGVPPPPGYTEDAEGSVSMLWTGGGVRLSGKGSGPRPYGQLNLYFVTQHQKIEFGGNREFEHLRKNNGAGLGAQAGVDIPVSDLLSIPIELNVLTGSAGGSFTGYGASVGLAFNFGDTPDRTSRRDPF